MTAGSTNTKTRLLLFLLESSIPYSNHIYVQCMYIHVTVPNCTIWQTVKYNEFLSQVAMPFKASSWLYPDPLQITTLGKHLVNSLHRICIQWNAWEAGSTEEKSVYNKQSLVQVINSDDTAIWLEHQDPDTGHKSYVLCRLLAIPFPSAKGLASKTNSYNNMQILQQ